MLDFIGNINKNISDCRISFFFFFKTQIASCIFLRFWGCLFWFCRYSSLRGQIIFLRNILRGWNGWKSKMASICSPYLKIFSLLGIVRKLTGCSLYSDLWLIIPGLILFFIPYFRIQQYKYLRFRLMLLANVLLYVVLFSTGSEASGYITLMIGVAIWYICSPSVHKRYNRYLFFTTLIFCCFMFYRIGSSGIRHHIIGPYALKAWPCTIVCFTICYEMIF